MVPKSSAMGYARVENSCAGWHAVPFAHCRDALRKTPPAAPHARRATMPGRRRAPKAGPGHRPHGTSPKDAPKRPGGASGPKAHVGGAPTPMETALRTQSARPGPPGRRSNCSRHTLSPTGEGGCCDEMYPAASVPIGIFQNWSHSLPGSHEMRADLRRHVPAHSHAAYAGTLCIRLRPQAPALLEQAHVLVESRPTLVESGPELVELMPDFVDVKPHLAKPGPSLAECHPHPAKSDLNLVEPIRVRAASIWGWPKPC